MDRYTYYEDMFAEINEIKEAIENLALMTQREFMTLRAEMQEAKEELKTELKAEIDDFRQETRAGFAAISRMVANHEYRIERLEKKTDIS